MIRATTGLVLLLAHGLISASTAPLTCDGTDQSMPFRVATADVEDDLSDAEPIDPAEFRPQTMPPQRPDNRGSGGPTWVALGPAPTRSAQVRIPPDNPISGAINALATHPVNADILYAATVNGGIWKTINALNANPTWVPQTDNLPSQSISSIEFDPIDGNHQTLIAGIGRFSNFAGRGDDEIGVYRTTDGGTNWTLLGGNTLLGRRVRAVAARGPILLAATNGGLFRSIDFGASWTLASGTGNLPTGANADLIGDVDSLSRLYISVLGTTPTVLRSEDSGVTWTNITTGIANLSSSTSTIRLATGASGGLFAAVVNGGNLNGIYRSTNLGANWTAMDVPPVHPGGQGGTNTAIVADPTDSNIVYVSGDRITASPFTADIRRGNASLALGAQFVPIVDVNASNTAPHADSRDMVFDAGGTLLETDDGGIYRHATPRTNTGAWTSVVGNLSVVEVHDLAHDNLSNIVIIGTQDNGTHQQQAAGDPVWRMTSGGDGGDVEVDARSDAPNSSFRITSSQNWGGPTRRRVNAAGTSLGSLSLPTIADPSFVTPTEFNVAAPGRLLIGGVSTMYEINNLTAASPTLTTIGAPGANRNAMAYGVRGDAGLAYVGRSAAVHKRTGNGGFLATTALPAGAATITDVAVDPGNGNLVFAIDDNQVFRSTDGGGTWTDVTGNLLSISGADFRTIEFMELLTGDTVAIGTRSGVFAAAANGNTWSLFGIGMPDVLVFDLRYSAPRGTLYAGTLGRGVFGLDAPGGFLFADGFE